MTSQSIAQFRRAELERRIEDLIALLDELDGDENLEETGDDEPWIGSPPQFVGKHLIEDIEQGDDDEYTLGWGNPMGFRIGVREEADHLFSGSWDDPTG